MQRVTLRGARPDCKLDHMRRVTVENLMDATARWPDGSPRNGSTTPPAGRAEALIREQSRAAEPCEVSLALGLDGATP